MLIPKVVIHAILYLLDKLHDHLVHSRFDKVSARVMFFDFSSAFNTIQPYRLAEKLSNLDRIPKSCEGWVLDYLCNRSRYIRLGGSIYSDIIHCSTGTVFAPFLFTVTLLTFDQIIYIVLL